MTVKITCDIQLWRLSRMKQKLSGFWSAFVHIHSHKIAIKCVYVFHMHVLTIVCTYNEIEKAKKAKERVCVSVSV